MIKIIVIQLNSFFSNWLAINNVFWPPDWRTTLDYVI